MRMAEADPDRVLRGEQGEEHPGDSAPTGGPHFKLFGRRLKLWSKYGPFGYSRATST